MDKYSVINEDNFQKIPIQNGDINLSNVTSITGVHNFDILVSDKLGCKFFLFGDVHVTTSKGFNIQNDEDNKSLYLPLYLDALFKKHSDKQFDFMIELNPSDDINTEVFSSRSVILSTKKQFDVCYQGINDKVECSKEWPNVRFHNVDIRKVSDEYAQNSQYMRTVKSLTNLYRTIILTEKDFAESSNPEKAYEFFNILKSKIHILNEINNNGQGAYLVKQMKLDRKYERYNTLDDINLANKYVENSINYEFYMSDVFTNIKLLEKKDFISNYEISSILMKTRNLVFETLIYLTDYYALIRFMKILTYPSPGIGKNIILLEGCDHVENFKNFIKTIDPDSYYIRGSRGIEDDIYNNAVALVNQVGIIKIPKQLKLGVVMMSNIYKKLSNYMIKNINQYEQYQINAARNISSILDTRRYIMTNKDIEILQNPSKRVLKINSSLIEDNLI